jgi:hypothetical protein
MWNLERKTPLRGLDRFCRIGTAAAKVQILHTFQTLSGNAAATAVLWFRPESS